MAGTLDDVARAAGIDTANAAHGHALRQVLVGWWGQTPDSLQGLAYVPLRNAYAQAMLDADMRVQRMGERRGLKAALAAAADETALASLTAAAERLPTYARPFIRENPGTPARAEFRNTKTLRGIKSARGRWVNPNGESKPEPAFNGKLQGTEDATRAAARISACGIPCESTNPALLALLALGVPLDVLGAIGAEGAALGYPLTWVFAECVRRRDASPADSVSR